MDVLLTSRTRNWAKSIVSRIFNYELLTSNVSKQLKDDVSISLINVWSIDSIIRSTIFDVSISRMLVLSSNNFFILFRLRVSNAANFEFLASKFSSLFRTVILI